MLKKDGEDRESNLISGNIDLQHSLKPKDKFKCFAVNTAIYCMCASVPGPIVPTINASGQVVITIVPSRVVKEISSGAETVAVDHPSWSLRHRIFWLVYRSQIIAGICRFSV